MGYKSFDDDMQLRMVRQDWRISPAFDTGWDMVVTLMRLQKSEKWIRETYSTLGFFVNNETHLAMYKMLGEQMEAYFDIRN